MTFEWIGLLQAKLVFIIDISLVVLPTINTVNDFWQVRTNSVTVISQCNNFFLKEEMDDVLRM